MRPNICVFVGLLFEKATPTCLNPTYDYNYDYSIHVTIEEPTIYPTAQQAINCLIVCQMLSNCYRDIQLFRFDSKTGEVFILAGDELQIIVPPDEPWKFLDETEL
jgi:hypothetical protein